MTPVVMDEPRIGAVVAWRPSTGSRYLYVAMRVGPAWETSADTDETRWVNGWPGCHADWSQVVTGFDLTIAANREPLGSRQPSQHDVVTFNEEGVPRAALLVEDPEYGSDWYVTGTGIEDNGLLAIRDRADCDVLWVTEWHPL